MSLILAIVYWLVIPVLAVLAAWWLWRSVSTRLSKGLVVVVSAAGFLGLFWFLAGGEQWRLDKQVRELCAKDGGIKVYETVKLPGEKFDKYGFINFYRPTQKENALGAEYVFKRDIQYYREGNPSLYRYHVQVFLKHSGRLLGESIGYTRGGGDLPGPWQPSSFSCPDKYGEIPLLTGVFVKSN